MKIRLLALFFALAALGMATPVSAATGYMLNYTTFQPYSKQAVAGPFDTYNECEAVLRQQSYRPGGMYSCDVFNYY